MARNESPCMISGGSMGAERTSISLRARGPEETEAIAARLAKALEGGWAITLSGVLGAGKTCFVRGLARGLRIDPRQVSSPTFVVVNEYEATPAESALRLVHVDAYRLSGEEELETLGWDELLADVEAVIAIEWPERITRALPDRRIEVAIDHLEDGSRTITIRGDAEMLSRAALEAAG